MTQKSVLGKIQPTYHELEERSQKLAKEYNSFIDSHNEYVMKSEKALREAQERFTSLQEVTIQQLEEFRSREVGLTAFKDYMINLLNDGLEVLYWHANGDTISLDSFIYSALDEE